ncbi:PREDICTED: uncharacterized protein LOC104511101, partial [Eurypyga helias]|uniref:uncharacterized protein LOC104511101 n=1 Tax=Eurypyga helias TaxID=54383 RepID=UPI0005294D73
VLDAIGVHDVVAKYDNLLPDDTVLIQPLLPAAVQTGHSDSPSSLCPDELYLGQNGHKSHGTLQAQECFHFTYRNVTIEEVFVGKAYFQQTWNRTGKSVSERCTAEMASEKGCVEIPMVMYEPHREPYTQEPSAPEYCSQGGYEYPAPPPYTCRETATLEPPVYMVSQPPVIVAGIFSSKPTSTICPSCRLHITTQVTYRLGRLSYLLCASLCMVGWHSVADYLFTVRYVMRLFTVLYV